MQHQIILMIAILIIKVAYAQLKGLSLESPVEVNSALLVLSESLKALNNELIAIT